MFRFRFFPFGKSPRQAAAALFIAALAALAAPLSARPRQEAPAASPETAAAAVTLRDALGRDVRFETPPARVVSLSPAITEILFAIGAGDAVVGVTDYCNYPEEALSRTKVGGFSGAQVSQETLIALKPDVVIGSAQMHEILFGILEQAGLKTFAVEPATIDDALEVVTLLARLTGHETGGAEVVAGMRGKFSQAEALSRGKTPLTVLWILWDDPLMTAGGPTFISDALDRAGARNLFADLSEAYPAVSLEEVISRDPDWIMTSEHAISADSLADREAWRALGAVRERRVATITEDWINRFGPRIADAVLEIATALYPPEP